MPIYHAQADVEQLLRALGSRGVDFTAGRPIPAADVTVYMNETEAVVEQRIRARYVVPVTDLTGVELLRYIAARLTAATVWRVIQGTTTAGESTKANEWERQAEKLLKEIVEGTTPLGDAELATGDVFGESGYNREIVPTRVFSLEREQW
jgi:hypothetical protein